MDHTTNFVATSKAAEPDAQCDTLTILTHAALNLAKTWKADGTIGDYADGKFFAPQQARVTDLAELSALLTKLQTRRHSCLIRGRYVGDELAAQRDAEFRKGRVRRALDYFDDQPLHAVCLDIDDYVPMAADAVTDAAGAVQEFILVCLPDAFHKAGYHWQLSNSAGHPSKGQQLRAHVWFWLAQPLTSAQLKAWAVAVGLSVDLALFNPVQIHYTSAPVMEPGLVDPVPVRSGFVPGDSVLIRPADVPAIAAPAAGGRGQRMKDLAIADPIAQALADAGMVKSQGRDGALNIECPFEDQHSTQSGETSTVYYLPNTGGFIHGHFKCLHASCQGRGRADFLSRLGIDEVAEEFAVAVGDARPAFSRGKNGALEPTLTNAVLAARCPDIVGRRFAYDRFRDETLIAPAGTTNSWRPIIDEDISEVRMRFDALGLKRMAKDSVRDAVHLVARENAMDSADLWLRSIQWDGTPRVEHFLTDFLGADDTPYVRAVSLYLWTALAGRVLQPGVKADMVPIFEGGQGLRKSSAIEAISPAPEFFTEVDLAKNEDDIVRSLRGTLVGEIAELSGLHTRELEWIKKFVVRRVEKWIPKYKEFASTFHRRVIFIGTTNRTDLLADETGNRRWLPLHVSKADVEGIEASRDQLWAEGAALFQQHGVMWQDAERLAGGQHAAYGIEDAWEPSIAAWLKGPADFDDGGPPREAAPFTSADVMVGALNLGARDQDRLAQKRVSAILRAFGFVQKTVRIEGVPTRAWRNAEFGARDAESVTASAQGDGVT